MRDRAGHAMAGGTEVALERVEGVNDNMSKSHYHRYFELYCLEAGARYHIADDQLHYLEAAAIILFPPFVMHHSFGDHDVRFRRVVLYFQPEAVISAELLDQISAGVMSYQLTGTDQQAAQWALQGLFRAQDEQAEFVSDEMRLLVNQLLIGLARSEQTDTQVTRQARVGQVIRFLHDHHHEQITLELLSKEFFVSQYHLCREFKRFTNSTIVQYLNNVRIGHAERLLHETDARIAEISEKVGFSNVTHFNRTFRQITGMSPSQSKREPA